MMKKQFRTGTVALELITFKGDDLILETQANTTASNEVLKSHGYKIYH
jgi:hypothetical protein